MLLPEENTLAIMKMAITANGAVKPMVCRAAAVCRLIGGPCAIPRSKSVDYSAFDQVDSPTARRSTRTSSLS
jgi:hypothetical protein